jgi:SAM-dependent methyltransferase
MSNLPAKNILTPSSSILWIKESLPLEPSFEVLQVAAGKAALSFAIADKVEKVIALDNNQMQLEENREKAQELGVENVFFHDAAIDALPYRDEEFDLAFSQYAIHHYVDPKVHVEEMVRVVKKGRHVALIDNVSPEQKKMAESYNYFQRLRDPSHTVTLTRDELTDLLVHAKLTHIHCITREIKISVNKWLNHVSADEIVSEQIREYLMREIQGGEKTGLRPFIQADKLYFTQTLALIYGMR